MQALFRNNAYDEPFQDALIRLDFYRLIAFRAGHSFLLGGPPMSLTPVLELTSLRYRYPGADSDALRGASLSLAYGERLAVSGPNGSGKSTLLRLALGLAKPLSGGVSAFGELLDSEASFRRARRRIGLLFQNPDDQLFCSTVEEDIAFGPLNMGRSRSEISALIDSSLLKAGLSPDFARRPCHRLSFGEKRLVALASLFAMEPDALLLDEPSAGLGEESLRSLKESLLKSGATLLLVSHDREFLDGLASARMRMADGVLHPA